MEYDILNNGCSFSATQWNRWMGCLDVSKLSLDAINSSRAKSYCDFLPGKIYNIAHGGSGIESRRVTQFLNKTPTDLSLTHFIYQIPHPSRQCIYPTLNEEEFFEADIKFLDKENTQYLVWELKRNNNASFILSKEKYLKKALREIHKTITLIRTNYSNIKIIFLRYEETFYPLIHEFGKDWFKYDLADYCEDNNITYIYEKDFHTKRFRRQGMTCDKHHPNKIGAEHIAKKIIEYL